MEMKDSLIGRIQNKQFSELKEEMTSLVAKKIANRIQAAKETAIKKINENFEDSKYEIKALTEEDETSDPTHTHGVWMKGGRIGEKHNKPMKTFGSHEEAKEYAKQMRKTLSPGEKKYYGLGFEAKPLKK